jgi:signal-transduction protein with cAMP-binding, CBS, and nucleotidyltransferase domain
MRVEEVMSEASCCRQGATVKECARLMKEENIGFVPICNQADEPVGAVTDRDLAIRVLAEGRSADDAIDAFMTRDVMSCRVGDDIRSAEQLMRDGRRSRVMVCDASGKLKGVISLADIAEATSEEAAGATLQQVKSDDQPAAH